MNSRQQAVYSACKYGGEVEDYLPIHEFFDQTEKIGHRLHRLLLHNAWGIFLCEKKFGPTIKNSTGRTVCVRDLGEQHVRNDMGRIPTLQHITEHLPIMPWMGKRTTK